MTEMRSAPNGSSPTSPKTPEHAMTTKTSRNWTHLISVTIVHLFILGVIAISFRHIVHLFSSLGLSGFEAFTAPAFVDGFMLLGKLGRSEKFAPSTRRTGLLLMTGAGAASLACNILAGDNLGQRIYGGMVVTGFVVAEWFAAKLKPAPVVAQPAAKLDPEIAKVRAEKAAATRRRNADAKLTPAQKAARTRKANREIDAEFAAMTGTKPGNAPVSPAVV